ncbi:MAG: hypothetical protein ABSA46_19975, partial [Thermodesulfovibrionales bacterium]
MKTKRRIKMALTLFLCFMMAVAFMACSSQQTAGPSVFAVGANPSGIAIDASGNVWVADQGSNTVTELNSGGTLLGNFAVGNNPSAIAIDASGNVLVANQGSNTVTELNSGGAVLGTFTVGTNPSGIAIDALR